MTAIREQIYQVAAADTGIGGVVGMLTDAAAGLKGGESSTPPPAANGPWAYLNLPALVPRFTVANGLSPAGTLSGGHEWWLYDEERAGYARVRTIAQRLYLLYGPYDVGAWNVVRWADGTTGPVVYGVEFAGFSNETADPDSGQLLLIARWSWVWAGRKQQVA